jgi:CheY-like chemotaxis protein
VGKGTGLGLSQVYGFIKQSDGDILVDSKVGDGTTITLTLPRTEVAAAAEQSFTGSQSLPVSAGRVLIVEDNADVGEFACQLLSDLGFAATLACTAEEALTHLEAADASFDVIFSDVVMPGMGGLELGKIVRKKWPHLPIVLTSGYSHVLAEESRHGFPLLHKPYSVDGLAKSLAEARRKHARAS